MPLQKHDYVNVKVVFFLKTATVFSKHVTREGRIRSFKHYYCKQHVRTSILMIDLKLLYDGKVFDAMQCIPLQNHNGMSHMYDTSELFPKI